MIIRSTIKLVITRNSIDREKHETRQVGKGNKVVHNRYTEPSGNTRRSGDNRERHVPDLNR